MKWTIIEYFPERLKLQNLSLKRDRKPELNNNEKKRYDIVGKVLTVTELSNRRGMYEHRVQYVDLDKDVREEIIRFIFEEERKNRKKERYNDK